MTKTTKAEPRYRWSHPAEWLEHRINTCEDLEDLRQLAKACAEQLDSDQIQDYWQSDMDADGYFQDLNKVR